MNNILWFDIQTCPECLTEEAWYSYEKRTAWERKAETNPDIDGTFKSYIKKASIYPEFSRVVSVAFKYGEEELYYERDNERELLLQINEVFKNHDCRIGGFNVYGFDIPFLWKRMIINKINPQNKLCITRLKPRDLDNYIVDVMNIWKQTSFTCSLDLLSLSLFGEKPNVDGCGEYVASAILGDNWDWVQHYNREALKFTIRCYEAMMYPEQREEKTAEEIAVAKMENDEVSKDGGDGLPF